MWALVMIVHFTMHVPEIKIIGYFNSKGACYEAINKINNVPIDELSFDCLSGAVAVSIME